MSSRKEVGGKKAQYGGPRNLWDSPGITELGILLSTVKIGEEDQFHDCASLSELLPAFATAVTRFSRELEMEPEGFIATAVHSLVWPTAGQQCYHVYTHLSRQVGYVEQTKFPRYLRSAIRDTWHYPGEEFSSSESAEESREIIDLSDYDTE